MAGLGFKMGNDDQLQFTFPFNVAYTHKFNRYFSLTARMQNMGGYHYLKADSTYQQEPNIYRFRYPRVGIMDAFTPNSCGHLSGGCANRQRAAAT